MEVTKWLKPSVSVSRYTVTGRGCRLRPLGILTLRDRVCMTAAMLVLEPIFEADLPPEQYACCPGRNAQQVVVEGRARPGEGRGPSTTRLSPSTGTAISKKRPGTPSSRSEGRAAAANMDVSARLVARCNVQAASNTNGRRQRGPGPAPCSPAPLRRSAAWRAGSAGGSGSRTEERARSGPRRRWQALSRLSSGCAGSAAANSAWVYGCKGLAHSSVLSAVSTIWPRYITAIRWLMCATVARSWPMNR